VPEDALAGGLVEMVGPLVAVGLPAKRMQSMEVSMEQATARMAFLGPRRASRRAN
jgi:hypothetical protein